LQKSPIHFADRRWGKSKMSLKIQLEAAMRIWDVWHHYRDIRREKPPQLIKVQIKLCRDGNSCIPLFFLQGAATPRCSVFRRGAGDRCRPRSSRSAALAGEWTSRRTEIAKGLSFLTKPGFDQFEKSSQKLIGISGSG
jgi:hypothetical protein